MMVREPIVAGRFYPADAEPCRRELERCLRGQLDEDKLPEHPLGGIVPHAGWMFSGPVAGLVFAAIAKKRRPATFVLFGAVHSAATSRAAIFESGQWQTPLGAVAVDERLAQRVLAQTNLIEADPFAHESEHSLEVLIPFIQHLFGEAKILPIMVAPTDEAHEVGQAVARTVAAFDADVVFVGSTDLTHYGPSYGFVPQGLGPEALRWAKQVNDRRLIELIEAMAADKIVAQTTEHRSACGGGAIAATVAACKELGATRAVVLEHTTSEEILRQRGAGGGPDAVGYAGILFC